MWGLDGCPAGKSYRRMHTLAQYVSLYRIKSPLIRHNLEALLLRIFGGGIAVGSQ
jgi:hypothetical protein